MKKNLTFSIYCMISRNDSYCLETINSIIKANKNEFINIYFSIKKNIYLELKDKINERVKHRQWYRPFAPSILREEVKNWFDKDIDSPYMSFCLKFKEDKKDKVPAVIHFDDTARLQTVSDKDNKWYHGFISKWFRKSGSVQVS